MINLNILPESAYDKESPKPGLYALSERVYRSANAANYSTLKHMLQSPAHYRYEADKKDDPNRAMIVGHLTHVGLLEKANFVEGVSHHVQPDTYWTEPKPTKKNPIPQAEQKKWRANAGPCEDWLDAHSDLPVITTEERDRINAMLARLEADPFTNKLVNRGHFELVAFANDPETGRLLKAKMDKLLVDDEGKLWIADLKTVSDYATRFESEAASRNYHLQAAFYTDILTFLGYSVEGFVFPVIESQPPHELLIWPADERFIYEGRRAWKYCLQKVIECEAAGVWTGYENVIRPLTLAAWKKLPNE